MNDLIVEIASRCVRPVSTLTIFTFGFEGVIST